MSLITTLDTAISDKNLLKIGELCVEVDLSDSLPILQRCLRWSTPDSQPIPCRIEGNGNFITREGEIIGKSTENATGVYLTPGKYRVYIGNKYILRTFLFGRENGNFELVAGNFLNTRIYQFSVTGAKTKGSEYFEFNKDVIEPSELKEIDAYSVANANIRVKDFPLLEKILFATGNPKMRLDGNLADFSMCPNLMDVNVKVPSYAEGSIEDIVGTPLLTRFNMYQCNIEGSLNVLLDNLSAAGKVSSRFTTRLNGTSCTYDGSQILTSNDLVFDFDENGDWTKVS